MAQTPEQDAPAAAMRELRMAVDVVSDALASASLDELEKAEDGMARAVAGVSTHVPADAESAAALRREVMRVRAALQRSRRLGTALNEFAAFSLLAQGAAGSYTRQGKTESQVSRHTVDTRV